jgi:glycosyltransferase involved in cell wall biosynthesis
MINYKKITSIIITVYSETFSVEQTIERLIKKDRGYILEIILLVHPNSSKESKLICQRLVEQYKIVKIQYQEKIPGVGWAIREGMMIAKGKYLALMSADLETEPEAIDRMMLKIQETNCDLVIGNRWLKGGGFKNYEKKKLVLNWIFQKLFGLIYSTKIGDLTYGFKIIKKELADNIQWTGELHEIYIETTVRPLKLKYKIEQIPTIWIGRKEGISKNTFFKNFRYISVAFNVLFEQK